MTATLDGLLADPAVALELYETMALIRRFEECAYRAYEEGDISGTVHGVDRPGGGGRGSDRGPRGP